MYYPEYEIATPIEGAEGLLRFSVPKRRPLSGQTVLICNLHLEKAARLTVAVSVNGVVIYRSNDASARSTIMAAFPEELMDDQGDNIIEIALGGGRPVWISDVLVLYNVPESLVAAC